MTAAERLAPLVQATLGDQVPIRLRCWDDSVFGPADAPVSVHIVRRRALRRIMWQPNELGFARAYVSGDLVIEGDLWAGLDRARRRRRPVAWPGSAGRRQHAARAGPRCRRARAVGPPPRPPAEESRLAGRRHSTRRDAAAIAHHYDVGNDFYRVLLGPTMTYSCAYWPDGTSSLEAAQEGKCELVARKLGLRAGMRVLDVGCGWGTFAIHAAQASRRATSWVSRCPSSKPATRASVSPKPASPIWSRSASRTTATSTTARTTPSPASAWPNTSASTRCPAYATALYGLLRPEGRLLNHAISRRPGPRPKPSRTSFIDSYVFPDGELVPLATMVETIEDAGFEVRDVQSLREHYTLTLRAWLANLEADWDRVVALSSPARARIWRLYIAGSALAFQANRIGVNQVLAVKPGSRGRSSMPMTRSA